MPAALLACMAFVSAFYQLPPRVLPSIQAVEGGRPGLVSPNRNGSEDLGVMQVNTLWIATLARHSAQPEDSIRDRLIDDGCFNIAVAGAILRLHLDEAGGDLLRAVGNYHSRTAVHHQAYRSRVLAAADRLFGPAPPAEERRGPPPPPLPDLPSAPPPSVHDQSQR